MHLTSGNHTALSDDVTYL